MKPALPVRILQHVRRLFSSVFGHVAWTQPAWFSSLIARAGNKPWRFGFCTAFLLAFIAFSAFGIHYWLHLPPAPKTAIAITSPPLAKVEENALKPAPVVLQFQAPDSTPQSVAPLRDIGKSPACDIAISPEIPGRFRWETDSRLVFAPTTEWPPATEFTVTLAKECLERSVRPETWQPVFQTMPLTVNVKKFALYQDPEDPGVRQAVATLRFSFPVDPESVEKYLSLITLASAGDKTGTKTAFTLKFDRFRRTVHVRSATLALQDAPRYLVLEVRGEVRSADGLAPLSTPIAQSLFIPDRASYFRVTQTGARIVRTGRNTPEQVLTLETTLGVTAEAINRHIEAWLLPPKPDDAQQTGWQTPGEITPDILKKSTRLPLKPLPADREWATLHAWQFDAPARRNVFIRVAKGLKGFGDFTLANPWEAVIQAPEYPKEIGFLHEGSLLALTGEQKLSVLVRGLPAVRFTLSRVLGRDLNHLITQTRGNLNNPLFINPEFGAANISEVFREILPFDMSDPAKQQYTALDFARFRQTVNDSLQGLFLLKAEGYNPADNTLLDVAQSRLILLTDMAMVVKDNADGTHDAIVFGITRGEPASGVTVTLLGKNGLPLLEQQTDADGLAHFPSLTGFTDEHEPVVYVARTSNDVTFIPCNSGERQLNYSRYDTGGLYSNPADPSALRAFLFSDRGMYRPGDTAHLGMLVKQAFLQPNPAGLPLQIQVSDPRGTLLVDKVFTLDASGFSTLDIPTRANMPTGTLQANLYLVKDNHLQNLLGSLSMRVAEFEPDRMRIQATIVPGAQNGWVHPDNLALDVTLSNLYGGAAEDRRVTTRVLLEPRTIRFASWPDYVFFNPAQDEKSSLHTETLTLPDEKTDAKGRASFHPDLTRFGSGVWFAQFFTEGFEAGSGRSVAARNEVLVSPLPWLAGFRVSGNLQFVTQGTPLSTRIVAVDPTLKAVAADGLTLELIEMREVSTLIKNPDGTLSYQTIPREHVLRSAPLTVPVGGKELALPTEIPGSFQWVIRDTHHTVLNRLAWTVAGASTPSDYNSASLVLKTDREAYAPGEEITLQIDAPYAGTGLLTIERDKVYALKWFKTDTPNTVQTIRIPENLKANGYVNLTFVRNRNATDVHTNPMQYAIAPFTVNHEAQTMHVDLRAPANARPGDTIRVQYRTDKPGKVIVFGVDEGILQVARYATPDPLAFFFEKQALEVMTRQTLDLILPQFRLAQERAAAGGDEGEDMFASHLNPFRRRTDLPVVFWSGLLETDTTERTLSWTIPDYFNGAIRMMAVAAGDDDAGSAQITTRVLGEFVLSPNAPPFVAPGDTFIVSASIANHVPGSGTTSKTRVTLKASDGIAVIGEAETDILVPEGSEGMVHFRLRAGEMPGDSTFVLTATLGKTTQSIRSSLSIRPAMPAQSRIENGASHASTNTVSLAGPWYPQYYRAEAAISTSPLILVGGLQRFLEAYPWGCTEQLTSQGFARLALGMDPASPDVANASLKRVRKAVRQLGNRQLSDGCFAYWPSLGDNTNNRFSSVYGMHFLTDAKARQIPIPEAVMTGGLTCLRDLAQGETKSLDDARLQAWAIYILTRNEIISTPWLTHLLGTLEAHKDWKWKTDITGAWIAASLALLQNPEEANRLIAGFRFSNKPSDVFAFTDGAVANAQYVYLLARHFPQVLEAQEDKPVLRLAQDLQSAEVNTVLAAWDSLALSAAVKPSGAGADTTLEITAILPDGKTQTPVALPESFGAARLSPEAQSVRFENLQSLPYYWQITQKGFALSLPTTPVTAGIEVYREYRDAEGNATDRVALGSEVEVQIRIRTLDGRTISDAALVDLLPGGFEVVRDSVSAHGFDFTDTREDRVLFFGTLDPAARTVVYRIRAISKGTYTIPPVFAESMYDARLRGLGVSGKIVVE